MIHLCWKQWHNAACCCQSESIHWIWGQNWGGSLWVLSSCRGTPRLQPSARCTQCAPATTSGWRESASYKSSSPEGGRSEPWLWNPGTAFLGGWSTASPEHCKIRAEVNNNLLRTYGKGDTARAISDDYLAVLKLLKCFKDRLFLTSLLATAARFKCLQFFNYVMAGKWAFSAENQAGFFKNYLPQ